MSEQNDVLARIVEVLGGDVEDVLTELRTGRLSDRFDSWVRDGANKEVTAEEIADALGKTHLAVISEQTGKNEQDVARTIAAELPGLIDEATPGGYLAALQGLASTTASAAYLRAYPNSARP